MIHSLALHDLELSMSSIYAFAIEQLKEGVIID